MNYIWELAVGAKNKGMSDEDIFFKIGRPFSGYMELSFTDLNEKNIYDEIEINPYYRYYEIFKNLFHPNFLENEEVIEVMHDLLIHHLKDIDVLMGMNKREYYIKFILADINKGIYGNYIKEKIKSFDNNEKYIICGNILNLDITGEAIFLLRDTIRRIFTKTYIFSNADEKDEIVFYLRTKRTKEKEEKIEVIKYLFLPFKCSVEIYWENMFGVLEVNELMRIDRIMNY